MGVVSGDEHKVGHEWVAGKWENWDYVRRDGGGFDAAIDITADGSRFWYAYGRDESLIGSGVVDSLADAKRVVESVLLGYFAGVSL